MTVSSSSRTYWYRVSQNSVTSMTEYNLVIIVGWKEEGTAAFLSTQSSDFGCGALFNLAAAITHTHQSSSSHHS